MASKRNFIRTPCHKGKAYSYTRSQPMVYGVYKIAPGSHGDWQILLTNYMKHKHCSRYQVYRMVRNFWLTLTKFRNRLYVSEICPDEIEYYLNRPKHRT